MFSKFSILNSCLCCFMGWILLHPKISTSSLVGWVLLHPNISICSLVGRILLHLNMFQAVPNIVIVILLTEMGWKEHLLWLNHHEGLQQVMADSLVLRWCPCLPQQRTRQRSLLPPQPPGSGNLQLLQGLHQGQWVGLGLGEQVWWGLEERVRGVVIVQGSMVGTGREKRVRGQCQLSLWHS